MIELIFIPILVVLGIVTSYEDVKYGRIRNVFTIPAIIAAILLTTGFYLYGAVDSAYVLSYFINLAISFALGFMIWYGGMWSAADAKLFTAFAALIPLTFYQHGTLEPFQAFSLFSNVFIPVFAFFCVKIITNTSAKEKTYALKKSLKPRELAGLIFTIIGIGWLVGIMTGFFNIQGFLLSFVLIAAAYMVLARLLKEKILWLGILLTAAWIIFDYAAITIQGIADILAIIMMIFLFRAFFINLSGKIFIRSINKKQLKKGMLLDGWKESLTERDIIKLKRGKKAIYNMHETIPFAPILFAGALLTIIFHGNLVVFLINAF
jgi:Flp pilus assembly protein protease CpaA